MCIQLIRESTADLIVSNLVMAVSMKESGKGIHVYLLITLQTVYMYTLPIMAIMTILKTNKSES